MASSAQAKAFINQIGYIIQEEAFKRGYKVASPIIAQACVESNYGVSQLSARWHNYFGLKCGNSWKGNSVNLSTKEEYTKGQLTTIKDNFRAYDSMEEGVKGYFDFISTKRYANLKTATTPKEYLERIKADGYATSSTYVNTNMNCIQKWELTKFDTIGSSDTISDNPYRLMNNLLKVGSKGESVQWLQWALNKNGANLTVDGSFGQKTKAAVIEFQKQHGLVQDGIAGSKTLKALDSV